METLALVKKAGHFINYPGEVNKYVLLLATSLIISLFIIFPFHLIIIFSGQVNKYGKAGEINKNFPGQINDNNLAGQFVNYLAPSICYVFNTGIGKCSQGINIQWIRAHFISRFGTEYSRVNPVNCLSPRGLRLYNGMLFVKLVISDIAGKCNSDLAGFSIFFDLAGNSTNNMNRNVS